jgi:isocitrate dehydrogenase (NAD+)
MLRASVMLLEHIGRVDQAARLEKALNFCMFEEKKLTVTGRATGATGAEFVDYVMSEL